MFVAVTDTDTESVANSDARAADADTDPESIRNARRRRTLSEPFEVVLSGLLYAVAAFALCVAVGDGDAAVTRLRENKAIDGYRVRLMFVTLGCAAIGCFAATRGLTLEQSVVSAVVVAGLAAAITSKRSSTPRALTLITVSASFVIAAAALDSMWPAVFSAALAGLPFLLSTPFVPDRRPNLLSAAVAALAGASIGITSAFFVLFVACLCALVWGNLGRQSLATLQLAPYIAAFTLVGILLNMSILT